MIRNAYCSSCEISFSRQSLRELFSTDFRKNSKRSNFMKIRRVGAELLYTDGGTDGHDEASSRFTQF